MISRDRLTCLPDDVIFHILSFLPTKISVRTSLLSNAWRFRWAHVPFLQFTCDTNIVNHVMLHHKRNVHTFHLYHKGSGITDYDFESWIISIFERNVRRLFISLDYQAALPRCMFASQTLVDLCILHSGNIPMDGTVYFPALKKLRLANVGYYSDESLPRMLSGCPLLEELIVERVMTLCLCCHVSSPTLTRLAIDLDQDIAVKLDTPALRYLHLRVHGSKQDISTGALHSLTEANIDLNGDHNYLYSCSVMQFVAKLYNVKRLTLSTRGMQQVPDFAFSVLAIKFHNLTELQLLADWRFITKFLENANNLRVLTIDRMVDHNAQNWMEPKQVPTCLLSHLGAVNVVGKGCSTKQEFDMLQYILKNAKVLKRMILYAQLDSNEKLEALKRLSFAKRGSPARFRLRLFWEEKVNYKSYISMVLEAYSSR